MKGGEREQQKLLGSPVKLLDSPLRENSEPPKKRKLKKRNKSESPQRNCRKSDFIEI